MNTIRCSSVAFAKCPFNHQCAQNAKEADFEAGSQCDAFNKMVLNRPLSNADRIRSMSDEELAMFQAQRYAEAVFREKADNGVFVSETAKKALVEKLYQVWFQYLRQPAEED